MDAPPGVQSARFSTEDYGAQERVAAWREVFGRAVVRIDIQPLSADGFRAEATVSHLPGLGLIFASTSTAHQANSRELIASDDVSFMAALTGRWSVSQLGWSADLQPGDGVLMSNGDVGAITLWEDCRYSTFCISRSALQRLVPDVGALFGRRVPGTSPELRMLVRYLELARDEEFLTTPALASAFAAHVCDLLALTLGASRDATEHAKMHGVRAARLQAMKEDIRKGLTRPNLSVHEIAARNGVSIRYVQKLFDESGTTFTRFVLEQRLTAAYKALTEKTQVDLSISTLAYDLGFADLSNFNKAFRQRFGCTPTDVRAR